jgi:hypothetical protein
MPSFIELRGRLNKRGFMNFRNTVCAFLLLAGPSLAQRQYSVSVIPSPLSDNNYVVWVSDDGSATFGYMNINSGSQQLSQCYSVKNGQFTAYPTPGMSCVIHGVNSSQQFTGNFGPPVNANSAGTITAFVNLNGSFDPFGANLSGYESQSLGINDSGAVVGVAATGGQPSSYSWVYSGGSATALPNSIYASAINNNGDVTGCNTLSGIWNANNCFAAIYRGGTMINLGTLSASGGGSFPQGINNFGQVAGYYLQAPFNPLAPSAPIPEPFFYDGNTMQPINITGAAYGGYADFMNDAGEVVGRYYPDNQDGCFSNPAGAFTCNWTHRAYYYANGTAVDLNSLLVNPPAGLVLRDVFYIGNTGLILAGSPNTDGSWSPTYLLTPVTAKASSSNGAITASPNPAIHTANGDAIITISWNAPSGVTAVEIRVGAPNGPFFTSGGPAGSAVTGPWVSNGMIFYLQDASNGNAGNAATLGITAVTVQ